MDSPQCRSDSRQGGHPLSRTRAFLCGTRGTDRPPGQARLPCSGVKRGDCVAFLGFNSPEMLALLFACARLGALLHAAQLAPGGSGTGRCCRTARRRCWCVEPHFMAQTARFSAMPSGLAAARPPPPGWSGWDALVAACSLPAPRCQADASAACAAADLLHLGIDRPAQGRRAVPPGAPSLQCRQQHRHARAVQADDVILTTLPLFHVGGLNNQTTPALKAGCTVVLHPKFDPDAPSTRSKGRASR
jgi:fatty-acyl-CoA synthase